MSDYVNDPAFNKAFWEKYTELLDADKAELDAIDKVLGRNGCDKYLFNTEYSGARYFKEYIRPKAPDYIDDETLINRYYQIQKFEALVCACLKVFDNWLKAKTGSNRPVCDFYPHFGIGGESIHFRLTSFVSKITNPKMVDPFKIDIVTPTIFWLLSQDESELAKQDFDLQVLDLNKDTKDTANLSTLAKTLKKIVTN